MRWLWATACGICWRPGGPMPWVSACSQEDTGGEELVRAGAYRVYADPADLLAHLDEVGVR